MNYSENYPLNVTPQGDTIRESVEKNRNEILSLVKTLNAQPSGAVGGSRQRVLVGPTLNGSWNFLSSDGLTVIINGSVTPVVLSFADGAGANGNIDYLAEVTEKKSAWSVLASNTSYLYVDRSDTGALTFGSATIAPVEQESAPSATSSDVGLSWFSTLEQKMYVWSGTAWQEKVRLFMATVKTDGSSVTSIKYKEYPEQLAPSQRSKLEAIESEATKNTNCISAIKIGDVTVTASGHQDTFTLTASGLLTLSANTAERTINISAPTLSSVYAQAKLDAHPVGSIYESTNPTSPADLFGGTWQAMDAGRVLVAAGTASTGTAFAAGGKGGEERHTLTTNEMPSHSHGMGSAGEHTHIFTGAQSNTEKQTTKWEYTEDYGRTRAWLRTNVTGSAGNHTHSIYNAGGDGSHNNMQPYQVVYRWQRTA